VLAEFPGRYQDYYLGLMRHKLGLQDTREDDAELISDWLKFLQGNEVDYTLSFRHLATRIDATDNSTFGEFETRWRKRLSEQEAGSTEVEGLMNSVNPLFIPRTHRVEQAIQKAVQGDLSVFEDLNTVLAKPFDEQPEFAHYAEAPAMDERVTQTFCGT